MTPNTTAARTAQVADTAAAERLLRDAAFVLRMTRRVKADILATAARPNHPAVRRTADRTCTPLGA